MGSYFNPTRNFIPVIFHRAITSNDRSFGCPIILTDAIHNAILFIDTPTMLDTAKAIFLSRKLYLAIIVSNENENNVRCDYNKKAENLKQRKIFIQEKNLKF